MERIARALELAQWVVVVGMFVVGAALWPSTPEAVPVHWNLAGQVDRYGGKFEGLFGVPIVALLVLVLFELLPRFDPHRARYAEFKTAYTAIRLGVLAVLACVYAVIPLWTQGVQVSIGPVIGTSIGAVFILIGLVIDQIKPNWFIGIRTPWTLSSERAWVATHRAARWVFVALGGALICAGFLQSDLVLLGTIGGGLVGLLGLVVYSYLIWRQAGTTA